MPPSIKTQHYLWVNVTQFIEFQIKQKMFTNKFDIFRTENSFAFTDQRKIIRVQPTKFILQTPFFLLIIFFSKEKQKDKTENKQQQQYN